MDFPTKFTSKSPKETQEFGQNVAVQLMQRKRGDRQGATIVCLYGDLGSGKTTFVQGFARGLGFEGRLLSPTFLIVRRYLVPLRDFFYHIDLYRVKQAYEFASLGLAEIFADPAAFVAIEWAEKLDKLLPEHKIDVWLKVREDEKHEVQLKDKR